MKRIGLMDSISIDNIRGASSPLLEAIELKL
jgi:hypothetical protein